MTPRPDIAAIAARFTAPPVSRFAPSPTGYLHLGHVVNALYVWGLAGALGGRVLLRIEDHDRQRSRPVYERAILDDLRWLGFLASPGTPGVARQSDRSDLYAAALEQLRGVAAVYACDCSRTDIGGERYPGRCRTRRLAETPGRGLRVEIGPGVEQFQDLLLGPLEQTPADQCGDILIRDRYGQWTYQFAVTVDDVLQGVTLVVRGADLVSSTGRQLRLARMLADAGVGTGTAAPIAYLHHPLVLGPDGAKLSKSHGSEGVRSLRQRLTPQEVIGRAAAAAGVIRSERPVRADELARLFVKPR
jgi:glutamyl-tRNA synthetase/glutamyl-Q tRNA(Asp) synthetase